LVIITTLRFVFKWLNPNLRALSTD